MKIKILLGTVSLLTAFAAFADITIADRTPAKGKEEIKKKAVEVRTFALKAGESATVTLPENATTGFQWGAEYDKTLCNVEIRHCAPEQDKDGRMLCGAPGTVKITMKLLTGKKAEVKLTYRRSWEKDIPPAETIKCVLTEKK